MYLPLWIMGVPLGYINTLYPRIYAHNLTVKFGIKVDNTRPREQLGSKEVAMKDSDGYEIGLGKKYYLK